MAEFLNLDADMRAAGHVDWIKTLTDPTAIEGLGAVSEALDGLGYSAQGAKSLLSQLNGEMLELNALANNDYGLLEDQVKSSMGALRGTKQQINQESQTLVKTMADWTSLQELRQMYKSGAASSDTVSQIASTLGLTEEQVRTDKALVEKRFALQDAAFAEVAGVHVSGYDQYLTTEIINGMINKKGTGYKGVYTLSDAMDAANEAGKDDIYQSLGNLAAEVSPENVIVNISGNTGAFGYRANFDSISDWDKWYATATKYNSGYGIDGLSELQKLRVANMFLAQSKAGTLDDVMSNLSPTTLKAFSSVTSNAGNYAYIMSHLNAKGVSSDAIKNKDASTNQDLLDALNEIDVTLPEAQKIVKDFETEVGTSFASLHGVWGDLTTEIVEGSAKWRESARSIAKAWGDVISS